MIRKGQTFLENCSKRVDIKFSLEYAGFSQVSSPCHLTTVGKANQVYRMLREALRDVCWDVPRGTSSLDEILGVEFPWSCFRVAWVFRARQKQRMLTGFM